MDNRLSKLINRISVSETIAMTKKFRELKENGFDVINLTAGESDFFTPDIVKQATKKAVDDNYSFYSPVAGYKELKEAICDKFKRDNNLIFNPNQIVVSTGAKHSLANLILCLLNEEDEVIIPVPYWVSYPEMVKITNAKIVFIDTKVEQNFKITPEQLEKAITNKTKLFIFSSPNNPSGSIYSKEELAELVKVFEKYPNIFIISDEIYEYINFISEHYSIAQFESVKDRVVVVNGISKAYAMTGYRIGYIAATEFIASACEKLQGQFTSGATSIAQIAALNAIKYANDDVQRMKKIFKERRDLIIQHISLIKNIKVSIPDGAFYVFADFSYFVGKKYQDKIINDVGELVMLILEQGLVATVSGKAFGAEDCIRISFAASNQTIIEAIKRIANILEKLKSV